MRSPRPFGVARHWPALPDSVLLAAMEDDDLKWAEGAYTDDFGLTKRAKARTAPKLLLDTHAVYWFLTGHERLSARAS